MCVCEEQTCRRRSGRNACNGNIERMQVGKNDPMVSDRSCSFVADAVKNVVMKFILGGFPLDTEMQQEKHQHQPWQQFLTIIYTGMVC